MIEKFINGKWRKVDEQEKELLEYYEQNKRKQEIRSAVMQILYMRYNINAGMSPWSN